jgi:hypothetical protein
VPVAAAVALSPEFVLALEAAVEAVRLDDGEEPLPRRSKLGRRSRCRDEDGAGAGAALLGAVALRCHRL